EAAARRHHGSEDQADLVTDASGGVLVQHWPVETRAAPVERRARAGHGGRERHALVPGHAAEVHRHRERGDLAVAHRAVDDASDQMGKLLVAEGRAISLAAY